VGVENHIEANLNLKTFYPYTTDSPGDYMNQYDTGKNTSGDISDIGVRAGKFLRVRRIFAQISANLPEKGSEHDLQKKRLHCFTWRKTSTTILCPNFS